MIKNIGGKERTVRILVGMSLLLAVTLGAVHGVPAIVMAIAAALLVTTGLLHYCPLYGLCKCSNFEELPQPESEKERAKTTE